MMKLNQLLRPLTRRTKRQLLSSATRALPTTSRLEQLEQRQLMSLTINVDVASTGGKTAAVTSVGQVIDLNVYATVTGNTAGSNDGFQSVAGSFLSTLGDGAYSVGGNLSSAIPTFEYQANGAQQSTVQDLNGDGYLDSGTNNNSDIAGDFNARGGAIEQDGTVSGDSQTFLIGTLSYTVTKLNYGQSTSINFRLRTGLNAGAYDAVFLQDNVGLNDETGTVVSGAPVVVTDPNLSVPNTAAISGNVEKSVNGVTSAFSGVTMFLDNKGTGSYASGDPTAVTDSSGNFSFTGLAGGTYLLRETVPAGYKQTSPSSTPTVITVTNGQSVSGQDFIDAATAAQTGSIAGTVTKVVNGASSTFAGVTVYLDSNNNGALDTGDVSTTTSSTGTYSFTGLNAGTYHVREVVPSGYTQTSPTTSPTTVTLSAGQNSTGDNFTDTAAAVVSNASIAGTVFKVVSGTTSGDSGVTVYLDTNNNGILDSGEKSTITSSTGTYSFTGLPAGTYYLRQVVPTGYSQTSPASTPTTLTLTATQASTGDNFTDTAATVVSNASIAGTVSKVVNGVTSADAGVTVYLDTNNNGTLDSGEKSTTTGSTGTYSFTGLPAGTYHIRQVVPTGYSQTSPATSPTTVTLSATQASTGDNFTDTAQSVASNSAISGTVYKVINGVTTVDAGVTVYLDTNNNAKLDAGEKSAVTSSTGTYSFTGLGAGKYYLREVVPTNFKQTSPSASPTTITLTANQSLTGQNFTDTATYIPGSIAGEVYNDANKNGKLDSGEAGLSGIELYIDLNKDGKIDSGDPTTTTASNGTYLFSNIAPGTWRVREVVPAGYTLTDPLNSVAYFDIIVQSNWQIHSENWGDIVPTNVAGTGSIAGTVYVDTNGNGKLDSGEAGIAEVEMYIDLKKDGKIDSGDPTTTTSSTGTYSFSGLLPGTYRVREVIPAGKTLTDPLPSVAYFDIIVQNNWHITGENWGNKS